MNDLHERVQASDVSRETLPVDVESMPATAPGLFGAQLPQAMQFVQNLVSKGEVLGLLGPREYDKIWSRHILNCAVVAPELRGHVADVGSGAGLPGIVLAIMRPDLRFTLIETMERRAHWLEAEAVSLGLHNVRVVNARVEDVAGSDHYDVVTARAVAALKTLVPWCAPLLSEGGRFLFIKGRSAQEEIVKARNALRKAKIEQIVVRKLGVGILDVPTTVVDAVVPA